MPEESEQPEAEAVAIATRLGDVVVALRALYAEAERDPRLAAERPAMAAFLRRVRPQLERAQRPAELARVAATLAVELQTLPAVWERLAVLLGDESGKEQRDGKSG